MKYAHAPKTRNIGEVVSGGDVSPADADSDDRKKTVIVLGSPRGGTSMTAGVLHMLGISMGRIRSPDALNPKGYFEDRDFLDLGDAIFKAADSSSNGFSPPAYEALTGQASLFDERIRALVEQRTASCTGNAWGWKTAATSHCVDLFLPYLPRPYFVVVLRNPLSVAQSARRYVRHENRRRMYDKLSLAQGLQVAAGYEAAIFAALERNPSIPTLVINYEQAVASPSSTIDTIVSFLDVEAPASTRRRAKRFISSNGAKFQWEDWLKRKFWAVNRWMSSESV